MRSPIATQSSGSSVWMNMQPERIPFAGKKYIASGFKSSPSFRNTFSIFPERTTSLPCCVGTENSTMKRTERLLSEGDDHSRNGRRAYARPVWRSSENPYASMHFTVSLLRPDIVQRSRADPFLMPARRSLVRMLGCVALPLALLAAAPAPNWCLLDWSQVCSIQFLRCTVGAAAPARCESAATCPLACENAPACPMRGHRGSSACASPAHTPTKRGRAYCLGDPAAGRGLKPPSPRLHAPEPLPVLAALIPELPTPDVQIDRESFLVPHERAPTESWMPVP